MHPDTSAAGGKVEQSQPVSEEQSATELPADEQNYIQHQRQLQKQLHDAGEGTRAYDVAFQNLKDFSASLDGKVATNWICFIPRGIGGVSIQVSRLLGCAADEQSLGDFQLWFDDQSLIKEDI